MPLNVELLQKVKAHILEEPRRLDMRMGACQVNAGNPKNAPCGTAACIAGWAAIISGAVTKEQIEEYGLMGQEVPWGTIENAAVEILGLRDNGDYVFYPGLWPGEYRVKYGNATTKEEIAKVTADRIDHLIATGN